MELPKFILETSVGEQLRSAFKYDPETGVITRRYSAGNVRKGSKCGSPDTKGYLRTSLNGKDYKLHRLAWFLYYGEWPKGQLDHDDNVKTNNKITNLYERNTSQNCSNQRGARTNNKLGVQGVHYVESINKYRAGFRGKCLGCFSSLDNAETAYLKAKKDYLK